ncbi:SDR family oxidoreductase [Mesobacillus foraminis]|uniref:SDR family NAD(P)-dependent oxidoreductase n=1 Tax=Mesobacillus foraminis TaxID=279826 RepID=UPI001BE67191|nr:SDR family oxidoreductase [Mesobacillus foraminis]MBT2758646.1 SDR family oxidoreductase [Mesobacillus foraminis]
MKSIIVTGAGSGLGKELSISFAQKGYHLILAGRTEKSLIKTKTEIEQNDGKASSLELDIRNPEDVKEKLLILNKDFDLYGLINNAGVGFFGPFLESSDQELEDTFSTNVLGTLHMTKAILPYLLKTNEGLVVNIISTAGLRGKKNEAIYCASKFAVRGFTESLQAEYNQTGVKIIAAYMGGMNTPFWNGSAHIADPSKFRSAREVAGIVMSELHKDTIIIESPKT